MQHSRARSFRSFLAFVILAPLISLGLVLGGPVGPAAAAVMHSGTTGYSFEQDKLVPGNWVSCTGTTFYKMDGDATSAIQTVGVKGTDCDTGPMLTDLANGDYRVTFNGQRVNGSSCRLSGGATVADNGDETVPTFYAGASLLTGSPSAVTPETACVVTEMCVTVYDPAPFGLEDTAFSDCFVHNMGVPEFPGGNVECSQWALSGMAVNISAHPDPFWQVPGRRITNVTVAFEGPGWKAGASHQVVVSLVIENPAGSYVPIAFTTGAYSPESSWSKSFQEGSGSTWWVESPDWLRSRVVGVQVSDWQNRVPAGGGAFKSETELAPTGILGTTNPAYCVMYFGEQIVDLSGTDEDVPAGGISLDGASSSGSEPEPINAPPGTPAASSCDFSWTDPTTWLEGGMCAAVRLLGRVVDLLGSVLGLLRGLADDIAAAISGALDGVADAILGGLAALFVPSDGFLDGIASDLADDWGQTSPAAWLDAVTGFAPGSVSGCDGVPLSVTLPGGVEIDERLGAACSGPTADAAAMFRIALSAVIVVSGGMACVRALGSGLGWSPGVGRTNV